MIKRTTLELTKGWSRVNSGEFPLATAYCCHEDGQLRVTWKDDTVTDEDFSAGDGGGLRNTKKVEVLSGLFSLEQ
jgi:hypothetical protein